MELFLSNPDPGKKKKKKMKILTIFGFNCTEKILGNVPLKVIAVG